MATTIKGYDAAGQRLSEADAAELEVYKTVRSKGISPDGKRVAFGPDAQKVDLKGVGKYGPDGMKGKRNQIELDGDQTRLSNASLDLRDDVTEQGWFRAQDSRASEEARAWHNMKAICERVDQRYSLGYSHEQRWTNDPFVFPDYPFLQITPFVPQDRQMFVPIPEDTSGEATGSAPRHSPEPTSGRPWMRLVDFVQGGQAYGSSICRVFTTQNDDLTTFCGPVLQGQLDNAYFVEALNAISLRPKLAQRMFHCWDVDRSIYVVRVFKNGMWVATEVDDYVPVADVVPGEPGEAKPLCCRSGRFPFELWPSLVEKAYAKVCTIRSLRGDPRDDSGGWEALGGGGCVEEALADLTGGVAGRFSTRDVTPDRLFVYLYALQRDSLFVCRIHISNCASKGTRVDPCSPHAVHRAALYEGHCYVLVYSPGGVAGLDQSKIPYELTRMYPERPQDGFHWCTMYTFQRCFDTIIECRLTNSPDVGIAHMPPPRLPKALGLFPLPGGAYPGLGYVNDAPPDPEPEAPYGVQRRPNYFEFVHANAGMIYGRHPPEFTVRVPPHSHMGGCEVIACLQQDDTRIRQVGPERPEPVPILLKVYEQVGRGRLNDREVCRSNWLPVRDSMVAFRAPRGGVFKIVTRFADSELSVERLIFRCYVSAPGAMVSAGFSRGHARKLVRAGEPSAWKWSFVGCPRPERLANPDGPDVLDDDLDTLKARLAHKECAVM